MNPTRGGWVILLTVLLALVLAMVHLPAGTPDWFGWLRPSWVFLVVFYWAIAVPDRMGLIAAWLTGLALDIVLADPLGLNALLLASVTYVAWRFCDRLKMYALAQQCFVVFGLMLATDLTRVVVQDLTWDRGISSLVFLPALVGALVWPLVGEVLDRLRLGFRVE